MMTGAKSFARDAALASVRAEQSIHIPVAERKETVLP